MLYAPNRAVFIHVPRTAGTSIAQSLLPYLTDFVYTTASTIVHRHAHVRQLEGIIPDWPNITKIVVVRPFAGIVASDFRLHKRDAAHLDTLVNPWKSSVRQAMTETIEQFEQRRWRGVDIVDRWVPKTGDVVRIEYRDLQKRWPEVCHAFQIPTVPLLRLNAA